MTLSLHKRYNLTIAMPAGCAGITHMTEEEKKYADPCTERSSVKEILEQENIFVMDEYRAAHQDIRPLSIGLLNLMPLKEDTELQILRSLSNTPIRWM